MQETYLGTAGTSMLLGCACHCSDHYEAQSFPSTPMLKSPPRIAGVVASTQTLLGKHRYLLAQLASLLPVSAWIKKSPKAEPAFKKPPMTFARQRVRGRKTVNPNLLLPYLFLG